MPHVACNELMPVSHFVHGMKMCLRKMPLHSLPYWYTVHEASRWTTTTTKRNSSMLHECKFVESENCTTTLLSMAPPTFSNIQVVCCLKIAACRTALAASKRDEICVLCVRPSTLSDCRLCLSCWGKSLNIFRLLHCNAIVKYQPVNWWCTYKLSSTKKRV